MMTHYKIEILLPNVDDDSRTVLDAAQQGAEFIAHRLRLVASPMAFVRELEEARGFVDEWNKPSSAVVAAQSDRAWKLTTAAQATSPDDVAAELDTTEIESEGECPCGSGLWAAGKTRSGWLVVSHTEPTCMLYRNNKPEEFLRTLAELKGVQ